MRKRKKKDRLLFLMIIPILASYATSCLGYVYLWPLIVIMIFGLVSFLPFCKKHENLWIFILTALCFFPINIFIIRQYYWWDDGVYFKLMSVEYSMILMGVEEILFGLIARLIWRRQYKIYLAEEEEE